jgi:hypothetical protein
LRRFGLGPGAPGMVAEDRSIHSPRTVFALLLDCDAQPFCYSEENENSGPNRKTKPPVR